MSATDRILFEIAAETSGEQDISRLQGLVRHLGAELDSTGQATEGQRARMVAALEQIRRLASGYEAGSREAERLTRLAGALSREVSQIDGASVRDLVAQLGRIDSSSDGAREALNEIIQAASGLQGRFRDGSAEAERLARVIREAQENIRSLDAAPLGQLEGRLRGLSSSSDDAREGLQEVIRAAERMQGEFAEGSAEADRLARVILRARERIRDLDAAPLGRLENRLEELAGSGDDARQGLRELVREAERMQGEFAAGSEEAERLARVIRQANDRIRDLNAAPINELESELAQASRAGDGARDALREVARSARTLGRDTNRSADELERLARIADRAEREIEELDRAEQGLIRTQRAAAREARNRAMAERRAQVIGGASSGLTGIMAGAAGLAGSGYAAQAALSGLSERATEWAEAANRAATDTKVFQLTLERFGVDAGEAEGAVTRLAKQFGMSTDDIRGSMTTLIRAGFRDMGQLEKVMEGAAASSIAFGRTAAEGFDRIADAAVTGLSAALNSIGIAENIGPALDKYAKSLGKTADSLTEVERAQTLANLVLKATGTEVEALDAIQNDYVRSMQDREGAEQAFAKTMGQLTMPIMQQLNTVLAEGIGVVTNLVVEYQEAGVTLESLGLSTLIKNLGENIKSTAEFVKGFSLADWAEENRTAIYVVGGALAGVLVPATVAAATSLYALLAPVAPFLAAGAAIGAALSLLGVRFSDVVDAIKGAAGHFEWVGRVASAHMVELRAKLEPTLNAVRGLFVEGLGVVRELWEGVVRPALGNIAPAVQEMLGAVMPLLAGFGELVGSVFVAVGAVIKNVLIPAWQMIAPVVKEVLGVVLGLIKYNFKLIEGIFKALAKTLQGDWAGAWDEIQKASKDAVNGIKRMLETSNLLDAAAKLGKQIYNGIIGALGGLGGYVLDAVANALQSAVDAMPALAQRFSEGAIKEIRRKAAASWEAAEQANTRNESLQDTPLRKDNSGLSKGRKAAIKRLAEELGVHPNDLAAVISFETAGTFSPSAMNPKSSATGLIQFMQYTDGTGNRNTPRSQWDYFGMSRDKFRSLSFEGQLPYVGDYFKKRGIGTKGKTSLAHLYQAVTGSGYKRGSEAYRLNKVWDANNDGIIQPFEQIQSPQFQAHRRNYFPDYQKPSESAPPPKPPEKKEEPAKPKVTPKPPEEKKSGAVTAEHLRKAQELLSAVEAAKKKAQETGKTVDQLAYTEAKTTLDKWVAVDAVNKKALKHIKELSSKKSGSSTTKKAQNAYLATAQDLIKHGPKAIEVIKALETAQKSGDSQAIQEAQKLKKEWLGSSKVKASVLQLEQQAYNQRKQLGEKEKQNVKAQAQFQLQIAASLAAGQTRKAQEQLSDLKDLQHDQLEEAGNSASKRKAVYERTSVAILDAEKRVNAQLRSEGVRAAGVWAKQQRESKILTAEQIEQERKRQVQEAYSAEARANKKATEDQARILKKADKTLEEERKRLREQFAREARDVDLDIAQEGYKKLVALNKEELEVFEGTAAERQKIIERTAEEEYQARVAIAEKIRDNALHENASGPQQNRAVKDKAVTAAYDNAVLEARQARDREIKKGIEGIKEENEQVKELSKNFNELADSIYSRSADGTFDLKLESEVIQKIAALNEYAAKNHLKSAELVVSGQERVQRALRQAQDNMPESAYARFGTGKVVEKESLQALEDNLFMISNAELKKEKIVEALKEAVHELVKRRQLDLNDAKAIIKSIEERHRQANQEMEKVTARGVNPEIEQWKSETIGAQDREKNIREYKKGLEGLTEAELALAAAEALRLGHHVKHGVILDHLNEEIAAKDALAAATENAKIAELERQRAIGQLSESEYIDAQEQASLAAVQRRFERKSYTFDSAGNRIKVSGRALEQAEQERDESTKKIRFETGQKRQQVNWRNEDAALTRTRASETEQLENQRIRGDINEGDYLEAQRQQRHKALQDEFKQRSRTLKVGSEEMLNLWEEYRQKQTAIDERYNAEQYKTETERVQRLKELGAGRRLTELEHLRSADAIGGVDYIDQRERLEIAQENTRYDGVKKSGPEGEQAEREHQDRILAIRRKATHDRAGVTLAIERMAWQREHREKEVANEQQRQEGLISETAYLKERAELQKQQARQEFEEATHGRKADKAYVLEQKRALAQKEVAIDQETAKTIKDNEVTHQQWLAEFVHKSQEANLERRHKRGLISDLSYQRARQRLAEAEARRLFDTEVKGLKEGEPAYLRARAKLEKSLKDIAEKGADDRREIQKKEAQDLAKAWGDMASGLSSVLSAFELGGEGIGAFLRIPEAVQKIGNSFNALKQSMDRGFTEGLNAAGQFLGVLGTGLNVVDKLGSALLNIIPGFREWRKELLQVADAQKKVSNSQVGMFKNPYADLLREDAGKREELANAGFLKRAWWFFTGSAPKTLSAETAKMKIKAAEIFSELGQSISGSLESTLMNAFSKGDFSEVNDAFDKVINNYVAKQAISIIVAKSKLPELIKRYADARAAGGGDAELDALRRGLKEVGKQAQKTLSDLNGFGGGVEKISKVDSFAQKLRESLESGVLGGISSGIKNAVKTGDIENLSGAIREQVGQSILNALVDQFMKSAAMKALLGPAMKGLTEALMTDDAGDDDHAMSLMDDALGKAVKLAEKFSERIGGSLKRFGFQGPAAEAKDGVITNIKDDGKNKDKPKGRIAVRSSSSGHIEKAATNAFQSHVAQFSSAVQVSMGAARVQEQAARVQMQAAQLSLQAAGQMFGAKGERERMTFEGA